ncbi:MAG: glycoside hydrolase family 3 N-terminal domain-containing protein [Prolixibacteraceae bacterium]
MNLRLGSYLLLILTVLMMANACNSELPDYKNPEVSVEKRVDDLLSRMTLEEKIAQMWGVNSEIKDSIVVSPSGDINIDKIKPLLPNGIGQITRPSEVLGGRSQTGDKEALSNTPYLNAVLTNKLQKYFIEETRLGIPAIFHEECLHGLAAIDGTSYPHPIALAGTFNRELVEKVYAQTAEETRLRGAHQALTPVVDVARDTRWGRIEETFGEDPYLVAQMGISAVKGFQGDGQFKEKNHIVATLKHFVAHAQPESGTNTAPVNLSERVLREVHFYPFQEAIEKAGALSVMVTYHEVDGVPMSANKWLITDILRGEMGFKGFVVSDYYAIREMYKRDGINSHCVARDQKQAAELAIKAGINLELPLPDCYTEISALVKEGTISEKEIDVLVGEMLAVKFRLGLFEDPYVDPEKAKAFCGTEARRPFAKEAALQSITLLENKNNAAPLQLEKLKHIAVIGPNANRTMPGGYSSIPPFYTNLLQGIEARVEGKVKVSYAEGCRITIGGSWVEDEVILPDPAEEKQKIAEAVRLAKTADVIVLALGGNEQTSREAWSNTHLGDRSDLELMGAQNDLIDALHATGKPIVAVLFNGAPLVVSNLIEKASAVFECWYLGQESGNAVADVLFGDYNPGAKLAITFPRSVGQVPCFYNYKPTARRGYSDSDITPLFPFGYGLSYTSFEIENVRLEKETIGTDESVKVFADLTNTGKIKGDEVVQMYIRDELSNVTRPVKELKDFKRVTLEPGETKTITLEITPDKLKYWDINMEYVVDRGEFTVMVGSSSADKDLQKIKLMVK